MSTMNMRIEKRLESGKNRVNKMRDEKLIPGVVYSRGEETQHVVVETSEFNRVYKVVGGASMFNLELDGVKMPVIIKEIQRHPVKNQILHLDFQKLNMDEKIRMTIPIVLINRDNIKLQPSVLTQMLDQLDIECLPSDIPATIEIDVSDMTFDTPIMISDLEIASNEDITLFRELDDVICTLTEPMIIEEDEEEDELLDVDVDVPVIGEEEEEEE